MKKRLILPIFLLLFPFISLVGGFPEIKGWIPKDKVNNHGQDDLWEYINGAADLFLSYGFQTLQFRNFFKGKMMITVEIYDMVTPLNAFGIYTTERTMGVKRLSIGTEAVVSPPYTCLLLKDRFYIKVKMLQGDLDDSSGETILKDLNSFVDGVSDLPGELSLLPARNRVTGSEGYVREGYMGLGVLKNVLFADYEDPKGNGCRYFLLIPSPGETPEEIWKNLLEKWTQDSHKGHKILYRDIPYQGIAGLVQVDNHLFGISGVSDIDEMHRRLTYMLKGSPK